MPKKYKTYYINGKLNLDIVIEVSASSLDDALEKSKSLKEKDFVDILGDFNDGGLKIIGIFENE